jgi:hypothetical protein
VVLRIFGPGGIEDETDRRRALAAIESWLVRRMICRRTTKNYNTIALSLLKTLSGRSPTSEDVVSFLSHLSGDSQIWPSDDEVVEAVRTTSFYTALTRSRLRMILDAIEASMHHPKVGPYVDRDRLTIEHILPQSWEINWPLPDGPDHLQAQIERDSAKHRLGNMALVTQALNSSLSNAGWTSAEPSKRAELMKYSQYLINKDAIESSTWGESEIRERGERFARVILSIWPKPESSVAASTRPAQSNAIAAPQRVETTERDSKASSFAAAEGLGSSGQAETVEPNSTRSDWTNDELLAELHRYERECQGAGLLPNSVHSYVDYARRFLRWRIGDYRPRDATGPAHVPNRGRASINELETDLIAYQSELERARLQPMAVMTYMMHSRQFVRWLDGRFEPGVNLRGR